MSEEAIAQGEALDCLIAYNPLGGYCIPKSSSFRHCAQIVARGHVFEPDTIKFLTEHLGSGDIVHAGTFFGDFLPALSRACAPRARIWTYEPNRENYDCASITIEMNALENVELCAAGLGDQASTAQMVTKDSEGKSLGEVSFIAADTIDRSDRSEEIRIVTIDDTVPKDRHVSIIQLDVEGYEQTALTGAIETIRRCRPILVLEKVPDDAWLAQHLDPLGYRIRQGVHGNIVLSCEPVAGRGQYLRLMLRNLLKKTIPYRYRRKVRDMQANRRAAADAMPDAGALRFAIDYRNGIALVRPQGHSKIRRERVAPNGHVNGDVLIIGASDANALASWSHRLGDSATLWIADADRERQRYAKIASILNKLQRVELISDKADLEAAIPADRTIGTIDIGSDDEAGLVRAIALIQRHRPDIHADSARSESPLAQRLEAMGYRRASPANGGVWRARA